MQVEDAQVFERKHLVGEWQWTVDNAQNRVGC
jgi:hypothetical protein